MPKKSQPKNTPLELTTHDAFHQESVLGRLMVDRLLDDHRTVVVWAEKTGLTYHVDSEWLWAEYHRYSAVRTPRTVQITTREISNRYEKPLIAWRILGVNPRLPS